MHIFCACEPPLPSQLPLPSFLAAAPVVFTKPNTEQSYFTVGDRQIKAQT